MTIFKPLTDNDLLLLITLALFAIYNKLDGSKWPWICAGVELLVIFAVYSLINRYL